MTTTTDAATTRCVIYAAKSTADEHGSIDSQISECRQHAGRQGWQVDEPPHHDVKKSAYHGKRGPGLAAAKARAGQLAAEGEGDVVLLVYATDRLARGDGKEAPHLVEYLLEGTKGGYRIESVTENMGGEMALVLASLYGQRAHADSKVKGAHTSRGIRTRVEGGHYHGGVPPYGYTIERDRNDKADPGRLVVVPGKAAVVRRIFDAYLGGAGDRTIMLALNADGIPSPSGKQRWDHSQVANILRQPTYRGVLRVNGEEYAGRHEPIVDEATWQRAQVLRQARRAVSPRGPARPPAGAHLLTHGLLRCGTCGAAMRPRTLRHRGTEWYRCSARDETGGYHACTMRPVPRLAVDAALLDHFETMVFDLDATREQIRTAYDARLTENAQLRAACQRTLDDLAGQRQRIRADYRRGALDADAWKDFRTELDEEQAAAEAELAQLLERQRQIEAEEVNVDVEGELLGRLARLRQVVAGAVLDAEGLDGLRAAIATTFERIDLVVYDDKIFLLPYVRLEALATYQQPDDPEPLVGARPLPVPQTMGTAGT
jgi:DNA invertase Pin-like site-specific DNA recombinase